jgi:hypothetical protein
VLALAKKVASELNVAVNGDLDPSLRLILEACCDNPRLFSGKSVLERDDKKVTAYLKKNIAGYHRDIAKFSLPKNKDANIDRAMFMVLRALSPKLERVSDVELTRVLEDHKTCMVAENVLARC